MFTRTEVKLIQPIFDFGKISAGVAAAEAGVGVSRQREAGARADVELNVRKAYYGLKFARDVIDMLDEGSGYVDDAQKKLDKDLANGTGNVSVTDKLRMRTVRAELDARILEAKRLQGIARDSLRTLLGSGGARPTSTSTTRSSSRPRSRSAPSPTTRISRARTAPRCGCSSTPSRRSARSPISSGARSIPTSC